MRIDLHTHSTASDGTESPGQVVAAAARAGLDVVALTDHDTTAGWTEASRAAVGAGLGFVPGVEISCRHEGISVHLLGYLHDPTASGLALEMERSRDSRERRAERMVERLAADFPLLTWDVVREHTWPGATVGRPHLADAMVTLGYFPTRDHVFAEVLRDGSPYHVAHYAPEVCAAVRLVREAGGVPVFAHPAASSRGPVVDTEVIEAMTDAGLAGLEVDHRDHDLATRSALRALAARLGLLVTGSSDYHGRGKPNLLGENTTDPAVLDGILEQARGRAVLG